MAEVTQRPTASSPSKTAKHKSDKNASSASVEVADGAGPASRRSSSSNAKTNTPRGKQNGKKEEGSGDTGGTSSSKKTKKRRKVNHACLYCRRSHMTCDQARPCSRCIKRNIPHLCHDEPRETKKGKGEPDASQVDEDSSPKQIPPNGMPVMPDNNPPQPMPDVNMASNPMIPPPPVADGANIVVSPPAGGEQAPVFNDSSPVYNNNWASPQNNLQAPLQDMQNFHPNYMFNTSEVTNEYNLLGDFLSNSLMDDGAFYSGDDPQMQFTDPSLANIMGPVSTPNPMFAPGTPIPQHTYLPAATEGAATSNPSAKKPAEKVDKAQERYYMTAADPAGTEPPEARMHKLLKAKYDAGLLKPFNHVRGYSRLNQYMEKNLSLAARQRILKQLDGFRPKFRERMQSLTDMELVIVEMWFERKLMEYDRVFASMAIPACCWRRTGEIFRGNREMSELIGVPIERLRDGKLAIHEFIVEESLVLYWEKFNHIAFDEGQKGILTSCSLKNPEPDRKPSEVRCCFSFTILRDPHSIPSLIIGNFLPIRQQQEEYGRGAV